MSRLLTADEVLAAELGEWRQLLQGLSVRYRTRGLAEAIAFAGRVGELADAADHHPDIDLRYRHVQLRLFSHDVGGITDRDIALARQISAAAADAGWLMWRRAGFELALTRTAPPVLGGG